MAHSADIGQPIKDVRFAADIFGAGIDVC